jgi:hypothetical protein
MTIRALGSSATIPFTASMPERRGITISIVTTSGCSRLNSVTASSPSDASPTTSCPSASTISRII